MRLLLRQSFDLHARYRAVRRVREAVAVGERLRVLDVGDPFGTAGAAFCSDDVVSVDVGVHEGRVYANRVRGSGLRLPFPDATFALVSACDVLEHIAPDDREAFVSELVRVSAGPVVITAPMARDGEVATAERVVNDFFTERLGRPHPALAEHLDHGLPDLDSVLATVAGLGHDVVHHPDGDLTEWVVLWLLKSQIVTLSDAGVVDAAFDAALNTLAVGSSLPGPCYREVLVIDPPAGYEPPAPVGPSLAPVDAEELTALAAELVEALPPGTDPLRPTSAFHRWVLASQGRDDAAGAVAAALVPVLEATVDGLSRVRPRRVEAALPAPADVDERPLPSVSIVLVNFNGAHHLPPILSSIEALDYPSDLLETIVVDNASVDGSLELLEEQYPWVRVLPQDTNLGFAPAVNLGAEASEADVVALINNDMRADPAWLRELVSGLDPADGVVCTAGAIVDWDGTHLDFAGGTVNLGGMGFQPGFGRPLDTVDIEARDGEDLLFACGGSMAVDRQVFLEVGGFDPDFFAYFEDVDFGWRLWLLGHRVRFCARARTHHRHHGTSSGFPDHQRLLLYERNSLRSLVKNYDDDNVGRAVAAAVLLGLARGSGRAADAGMPIDVDAFRIGGDRAATEDTSRALLASVLADLQVLDDLPSLLDKRAQIQTRRVRSDHEILQRFGRPTQLVRATSDYAEAQAGLLALLGLDQHGATERAGRVAVVFNDPLGDRLAGPAIRAWALATHLTRFTEVVVVVPEPTDRTAPGVQVRVANDDAAARDLVDGCDAVVLQGYVLNRFPSIASCDAVRIIDLYDPWIFENLVLHDGNEGAERRIHGDLDVINQLLDVGDMFICASERQRDYWVGALSTRGRTDATAHRVDPTLRRLIDVVPFGLDPAPPRRRGPILRGLHPEISSDDPLVLWGGGIWDWFDPEIVIEAFARVVDVLPRAKLYFLGTQLPKDDVPAMAQVEAALACARAHDLLDTNVVFGEWAPYDRRQDLLLEADIAVSAALEVAETRLSFRSRVLDYLWARLPVVCTSGDVLADVIAAEQVGVVVEPGDVEGFAEGLHWLLTDNVARAAMSRRMGEVAERFRWDRAVEPLRAVTEEPWRWRSSRTARPMSRVLGDDSRYLLSQRRAELDASRAHAAHLEAIVAQQAHRLEQLRRIPGASQTVTAARRVRDRLKGG